jgi:hypothetical protein
MTNHLLEQLEDWAKAAPAKDSLELTTTTKLARVRVAQSSERLRRRRFP